jgi:hypothetical protein
MKTFVTTLALVLAAATVAAQERAPQPVPQLRLALPEHAGSLTVGQAGKGWLVEEYTAKPNGTEFAVQATDGAMKLRARLFVSTIQTHWTASSCRDQVLVVESAKPNTVRKDSALMTSVAGAEIAKVQVSAPQVTAPQVTAPQVTTPQVTTSQGVRAFVAAGDLCGDLVFTSAMGQAVSAAGVDAVLQTVEFAPLSKPTFRDAFAFATVEFEHQELEGAVRGYRAALALAAGSDDPLKWRRVTTDQLAMSLGMGGDITSSRAVNVAAIRRDPTYPMYYYNLACADGEETNMGDAERHLTQAFERRANVLPGETMPDPATDDSFQVLMQDPSFAAFVKTLHAGPSDL